MAGQKVYEYRGVSNAVIALVTVDDNETGGGYAVGEVMPLVPVAEVGKTVEISSEAHYYDNQPLIIIEGEGPDEISITGAGMDMKTLALISGRYYDENTGMMVEGPHETRYFAFGYVTKTTAGENRYVWRYKGTFGVPEESHITMDDGTEATGTTLTYTGIYTTHKFTKGKYNGTSWEAAPVKGIVVPDEKADVSTFFDTVTTPDAVKAKTA